MANWTFDDYDEMGRHYYCSECGCGIMVADNIGHWTPNKCPNCKAKMEAPNEPLSIEQLREMDGEPVWVVPTGTHKKDEPMWCVLEGSMALIPGVDCWLWDFDGYGETWMAYRRPPEVQS